MKVNHSVHPCHVEESPPFSIVGIDFAGPLYIKDNDSMKKVWICFYTCCVVRAILLELVPDDLSTTAFFRSIEQFATG